MKRNATTWVLGLGLAALALVPVVARATIFTSGYEGDNLPTNSATSPVWGFPFTPSAGATESASGGILTVETTVNTDDIAYRQTANWSPTAAGSTVEARLKVDTLAAGSAFSQELQIRTGSRLYFLAFTPTFVREVDTGTTPVHFMDTSSSFHTYRFTVNGLAGTGSLYVDGGGTPVFTWAGVANAASVLDFGDTGSSDGGRVQWDYLRWTNAGAFAPVPEPSLFALLGLGWAMLRCYRRKR